MECKICNSETKKLFESLVLNKYEVEYFKCPNCDFIQTEKPSWLDDAYGNAITDLDIGLVSRNLIYADIVEKIIKNNFDINSRFLDYAGGYGLFVRLMRDKGFDFYREDKYCQNIFAQHYDLDDFPSKDKFEVITAFEVFEHLENPLSEIEKMLEYSDSIIFSTEFQPGHEIKHIDDWWYFTPQTGQHIAFYSEKTMNFIAEKFHCTFYTDGELHFLSKLKLDRNPLLAEYFISEKTNIKMPGLLRADFEFAKNVITKNNDLKEEIEQIKSEDVNATLIKRLAYLTAEIEKQISKADFSRSDLSFTKASMAVMQAELDAAKAELDAAKAELEVVKLALELANGELASISGQLSQKQVELASISASREWQMALILSKISQLVIPKGSNRRLIAVKFWRLIKPLRRLCFAIIGRVNSLRLLLGNYFKSVEPREKRKINRESKKIAYIGHSYHNKTKSTAFLIDYLKQFYEVEVVLDESWEGSGKVYPDLSFIDESYLGVIFFQNLPSIEVLRNIKNENLIFFPMYDGVRHDYDFWNPYREMKIANFSSTLHSRLTKWGFDSIAVQYFPKPQEFIPGNPKEIFFWQRLTRMNIDLIAKLIGKATMKMHIHRAIDPNQQFQQPNKKQEEKFKITYSEWFETRTEMWDLIKQKGIYIAPREYEGIGMSFLEAMAMGKAVIAVDNPTMNEYIINGKNGYLFDLKNPKEIDLSDIEKVQKNTYEFMKAGYAKWEKDKHEIIEFIEKE